jgi:hypothetical protein
MVWVICSTGTAVMRLVLSIGVPRRWCEVSTDPMGNGCWMGVVKWSISLHVLTAVHIATRSS